MFELKNASAAYNGKTVLHDVSLQVRQGERIALVGSSGAGKSTLLSLIYQNFAEHCALVPQDSGLVKPLSVFHNVYMGRLSQNPTWYNLANLVWPLQPEVTAVREVLAPLALEDKLNRPAGELSGGERQRTAVARAIFQGGEVLLGDEPVSAVDVTQARTVLDALHDAFPTAVLALHDVQLALNYADRIVGIRDGRIVLDKPSKKTKVDELKRFYTD